MIGIDTSVMLRYLTQDDPAQSKAANEVLDHLSPEEPGWIGNVVLVETLWSLKKTYQFSKDQIVRIADSLLASRDIELENRDKVERALLLYRTTRAGFSDCLITICATTAGCRKVVTFDRIAGRDLGMERLKV